jgi:SSS family solute:Na+ symporter
MRTLDLGVIVVYLAGITWFGARFRKSQTTLKDYFLGGRTAPWWAIGFSIVSAETSILTVISTPGMTVMKGGNFGFLQLVFGYLAARILISTLFLPAYFKGELFTAYELMTRRFGSRIRKLTAGLFLVLRALAEGVRVWAMSTVVSIVLGTGEELSIILIVCLTLFYTFEGGMSAVIWTDVIQMFLYIAGAILSLFVILNQIPGGWAHVVDVGQQYNKFQIFDFRFAWNRWFIETPFTFWAGFIGGCFLTTASHGTEQLMVQRLLSAKSEADARKALFSSWAVILFQFTLFLIIGVCLFAYHGAPLVTIAKQADRMYPEFVWNHLPQGIAGLIIAAILAAAMSNLSAALNSLASTTVMDFWKPLSRVARADSEYLRLARYITLVWGAILFGVALLARGWGSVLQAGLSIASILYGSLLGVFLLGLLTRRTGEIAAMCGMTAGLVLMLYVKFGTTIAWTWYVLIGTTVTFVTAFLLSFVIKENPDATSR